MNPLYAVTMNAKWDAMDRYLNTEPHLTKYAAWLDIGCFRAMTDDKDKINSTYTFKLEVPPDFNDSTISYSQIIRRDYFFKRYPDPWTIIKGNHVWVGGAYFVGTNDAVRKYVHDYRSAVKDLLAQNMTSTDQQVIASLHSRKLPTQPSVEIKEHTCKRQSWFCMAYKCKEEAEKRDLYCPC